MGLAAQLPPVKLLGEGHAAAAASPDDDAFHLVGVELQSLKVRTFSRLAGRSCPASPEAGPGGPRPHGVADSMATVPSKAVQRVQRLIRRKQERESWRMERRHVDAIRDPSELAIAGREQHGRAPAGRVHGRSGRQRHGQGGVVQAQLPDEPEERWKAMNVEFRYHDLHKDGTVSNAAFVKILRGLDLFLGEDAMLELLQKYECRDKARAGMFDARWCSVCG